MARYRKYTKTIVKTPKAKWNKGNVFGQSNEPIATNGADIGSYYSIAQNSTDTSTPVPVTVQVKHIRITGQVTITSAAIETGPASPKIFQVFAIYCPQIVFEMLQSYSTPSGRYTYMRGLVVDHPEYIMAQKTINLEWDGGVPGEKKVKAFTLTSGNLKRNLRSGDRILFFYMSRYITNNKMYTTESFYAETSFVTRNV